MRFRKPIGLFLCGGGALGSWQSGVLSVLVNAGIEFDIVAGFSIGSVNGAAYCFGRTSGLKEAWGSVSREKILRPKIAYNNIPLELVRLNFGSFLWKLGLKVNSLLSKITLFSGDAVYDFLSDWIITEDPAFKKRAIFYIISHCVERKLPYITRFDKTTHSKNISFVDAIAASCAIPMIFPPVKIRENGNIVHLVDGGIIGMATINLNMFEGCGTIIIISNSFDGDLNHPVNGPLSYFESNARRILAIHVHEIYNSRMLLRSKPDVHLIKPPGTLGLSLLDFDGQKCVRAFEVGEEEGKKWNSYF
ncbi:MAG: patatin-like phospholipase family protein [Elusimicrobia bacterium]|nr:patatin-like phospholipase family protein [Elusimicrobiota bacterium]